MFTMRLTARSCPTIFPKSRRSTSSTSGLRISGSRRTSSETNGLTIALHLLPVFPSVVRTARSISFHFRVLQLFYQFRSAIWKRLTTVSANRWHIRSSRLLSANSGRCFTGLIGYELLQWYGDTGLRTATRSCWHKTHVWPSHEPPDPSLREFAGSSGGG